MATGIFLKTMKTILFLILTSSLFAQKSKWINYDQKTFDSKTCCWRELAEERKFNESANLILNYLKNGKPNNKQSLNWHAGQMLAFAGNYKSALKYMGKTYSVFQKWFGGEDGKAWFFFAKGTTSFLKRDKAKLENIIRRWKKKLPLDKNLEELERLNANWNLSYENATSGNTR